MVVPVLPTRVLLQRQNHVAASGRHCPVRSWWQPAWHATPDISSMQVADSQYMSAQTHLQRRSNRADLDWHMRGQKPV